MDAGARSGSHSKWAAALWIMIAMSLGVTVSREGGVGLQLLHPPKGACVLGRKRWGTSKVHLNVLRASFDKAAVPTGKTKWVKK